MIILIPAIWNCSPVIKAHLFSIIRKYASVKGDQAKLLLELGIDFSATYTLVWDIAHSGTIKLHIKGPLSRFSGNYDLIWQEMQKKYLLLPEEIVSEKFFETPQDYIINDPDVYENFLNSVHDEEDEIATETNKKIIRGFLDRDLIADNQPINVLGTRKNSSGKREEYIFQITAGDIRFGTVHKYSKAG